MSAAFWQRIQPASKLRGELFRLSVKYMRAHYALGSPGAHGLVMGVVKHLDNTAARVALGHATHKSHKSPAASQSPKCYIYFILRSNECESEGVKMSNL